MIGHVVKKNYLGLESPPRRGGFESGHNPTAAPWAFGFLDNADSFPHFAKLITLLHFRKGFD
jgi:hypothetical protein